MKSSQPGCGGSRHRALGTSAALHGLALAGLLALPVRIARQADAPPVDIVFYTPQALEREVIPVSRVPEPESSAPAPAPPRKERRPVAPRPAPRAESAPPIVRDLPPARAPVQPLLQPPVQPTVQPALAAVPRPIVPRVDPLKPTVRTDLFAENRPARTAPSASTASRATPTGVFVTTRATAPERASVDRPAAEPVGGFEILPAAAPSDDADRRVVAGGSFGGQAGTSAAPRQTSPTPGPVGAAGFGGPAAVRASRRERQQPAPDLDTPVEIVSKPKPLYTEEARQLRVEGEVVLEVTFVATGQLRVLRVVGGLGHGLDETAVEAAREIRFKPARSDGRPVDHTTTLRVVFKLA